VIASIFPLLFLLGLVGVGVVCMKMRAAFARAGDPPSGCSALLLALTRNPGAMKIEHLDEDMSAKS
jgi:hypothetical protein